MNNAQASNNSSNVIVVNLQGAYTFNGFIEALEEAHYGIALNALEHEYIECAYALKEEFDMGHLGNVQELRAMVYKDMSIAFAKSFNCAVKPDLKAEKVSFKFRGKPIEVFLGM